MESGNCGNLSLWIPVVAIEAGMKTVATRVNKDGYFVTQVSS